MVTVSIFDKGFIDVWRFAGYLNHQQCFTKNIDDVLIGLGPLPEIISYHLPPVTNVLQPQPHQSVISILSHITFGHAPQPNGPNVESVLQRRLADRKAALWFFCSNVFFGS